MRYLDYDEFVYLVDRMEAKLRKRLAKELRSKKTRVGVLGIGRGGLPTAVHLSHALDLPFSAVIVSSYGNAKQPGAVKMVGHEPYARVDDIPDHIILVDDIVDTGATLAFLRKYLDGLGHGILPRREVKVHTCALIYKPTSSKNAKLDVYGLKFDSPEWVAFPWDEIAKEGGINRGFKPSGESK